MLSLTNYEIVRVFQPGVIVWRSLQGEPTPVANGKGPLLSVRTLPDGKGQGICEPVVSPGHTYGVVTFLREPLTAFANWIGLRVDRVSYRHRCLYATPFAGCWDAYTRFRSECDLYTGYPLAERLLHTRITPIEVDGKRVQIGWENGYYKVL